MYTWVFELTTDEWTSQLENVLGTDVESENITPDDLPNSTTHTGWTKVDGMLRIQTESDTEEPVLEFIGGRPPLTRPHLL